jgi:hypothetical protein
MKPMRKEIEIGKTQTVMMLFDEKKDHLRNDGDRI